MERLTIRGTGTLLQTFVCRNKRELKGEMNAKEISDGLPFLEYELHSQLLNKLRVKGMNAIFGLKVNISCNNFGRLIILNLFRFKFVLVNELFLCTLLVLLCTLLVCLNHHYH